MPVCITLQKLWDIVPLIVNGNSDEALDSSEPITLGHCMCPYFLWSSENVKVMLAMHFEDKN